MIYWLKKFFSDPSAHWKAFCEVFTVLAFAFALYLGSYLRHNAQAASDMKGEFLESGEIFLLIYALYGTLFYLAFIHVGKPANGPKKFLGLLVTLIVVPIILMSGFDPTFRSVVNEDINTMGYQAFGVVVASYYGLLFFQELSPPDPEKVLEDGARTMADQARELNR